MITDPLPVDPRLVEALVSHGIAVAVDEADAQVKPRDLTEQLDCESEV